MNRIFISQPMKGKSAKDILEARKLAIESATRILEEPIEVIDNFFQGAPVEAKPLWFIGKSIQLLSDADAVVFVEGWEEARGCKIEHKCAVQYGIPIIYVRHCGTMHDACECHCEGR